MTKPDFSVFLWTNTAQSAHLIICFFLSNSSLRQLSSWEPLSSLECDASLFWSHLPAQGFFPEHNRYGRDLPRPSTGHSDTLVTQAVKSQTNQPSQRLDPGVSGCWAQGHRPEHVTMGRIPPVWNWTFRVGAKSSVVCRAALLHSQRTCRMALATLQSLCLTMCWLWSLNCSLTYWDIANPD